MTAQERLPAEAPRDTEQPTAMAAERDNIRRFMAMDRYDPSPAPVERRIS